MFIYHYRKQITVIVTIALSYIPLFALSVQCFPDSLVIVTIKDTVMDVMMISSACCIHVLLSDRCDCERVCGSIMLDCRPVAGKLFLSFLLSLTALQEQGWGKVNDLFGKVKGVEVEG